MPTPNSDSIPPPVDYKAMYEAITTLLHPVNQSIGELAQEVKQLNIESANRPTREDFDNLRTDVKHSVQEVEGRTYSRELLDMRFAQVAEAQRVVEETRRVAMKELTDTLMAMKTSQTGQWDRAISRASVVVMLIWILIQLAPYLARL